MCDHTNDPGGREAAMVTVIPGTPERRNRDAVWCDPCLAPLVKALNEGGVRTVASCCGHGTADGWIALDDGRVLGIFVSLNQARRASGLLPVEGGGTYMEAQHGHGREADRVEYAVELDDLGARETYGSYGEASQVAHPNGLRVFRIEHVEVPA